MLQGEHIFRNLWTHTLNLTCNKDSLPKSDQGPILPLETVNKQRGKKTLLRRREFGEEVSGFTNGKVSKKRVKMACSICGAAGHKRIFHGNQVSMAHSFFSFWSSIELICMYIACFTSSCVLLYFDRLTRKMQVGVKMITQLMMELLPSNCKPTYGCN